MLIRILNKLDTSNVEGSREIIRFLDLPLYLYLYYLLLLAYGGGNRSIGKAYTNDNTYDNN